MTKQELIEALRECVNKGDPEDHHLAADQLLLDYINDPEVQEAFDNIEKWYA